MQEIGRYTEPVKKHELILALIDIDKIKIPPFQRDLSEGLKKNLLLAIEKLGFLHPIIVFEHKDHFYVLDGHHRLEALKELGYEKIPALIVPEDLGPHILDFNTEKPPNIKERARQAYRLFREFWSKEPDKHEIELFSYFKDPSYLTFGFVLEEFQPRFPAGFYEALVAKIDRFLDEPLSEAAKERRQRAQKLLALNKTVNEVYDRLGFTNALLKGEIVRKAVQKAYGARVRKIEDDFYTALDRINKACKQLVPEDFGGI